MLTCMLHFCRVSRDCFFLLLRHIQSPKPVDDWGAFAEMKAPEHDIFFLFCMRDMSPSRTLCLHTAALNTELASPYLSILTRARRYVNVRMGPCTSDNSIS
jgi:hypothetical protein